MKILKGFLKIFLVFAVLGVALCRYMDREKNKYINIDEDYSRFY